MPDPLDTEPGIAKAGAGDLAAVDIPRATVDELLELAGIALAFEDLDEALHGICVIAERALEQADGASLTAFGPSGPRAAAASNEWAGRLDEIQYAEHEGPCIDAARSGTMFRVRDVDRETRWPSYMPLARNVGARSMVSAPMTVETKTIGALNVYSRWPDAFSAEDASIIEIVAAHGSLAAAVSSALLQHRSLADNLRTAMASRAAIEQAKGIIMANVGCSPDEAFVLLSEQSQHENRKVREIAEETVRRTQR